MAVEHPNQPIAEKRNSHVLFSPPLPGQELVKRFEVLLPAAKNKPLELKVYTVSLALGVSTSCGVVTVVVNADSFRTYCQDEVWVPSLNVRVRLITVPASLVAQLIPLLGVVG